MILKILVAVLACGAAVDAIRRPLTKSDRKSLKDWVTAMELPPVVKILSGYADVFPNMTRYKVKFDSTNDSYCHLKLEVWQMPDGSVQINDDYTQLNCVA